MFERFTDRARHVVVLAQGEAGMLGHDYIGTEHLLLGLLSEEEGMAAQVLGELGIRLESARSEVESIIGRGQAPSGSHIPFTPRAKKVLELALREALAMKSKSISAGHITLGLLREGEGLAMKVLADRGVDLVELRRDLTAALAA